MNTHTLRQQLSTFLHQQELPENDAPFLWDQRKRYQSENVVVVQPEKVSSIQKVVRFCDEHNIPLTPQGGNTGLVGGTYAQSGVVLNLSRLNKILDLSLSDQSITVQAGCVLADVQAAALRANRFFPLSLASEGSCQIGGNIACNAGGLNVVRYGTMRDLVLGLEVVLPDGSLISQLSPLHKNTTGYDLRQLFIGSEGTLGIITAATLKLFCAPKTHATAWVGVKSIEEAIHLLSLLHSHFAERVSSFELISEFALHLSAQFSQIQAPLSSPWHLLIELNDGLIRDDLGDLLLTVLYEAGFEEAILAKSEKERQLFWLLRENISAAQRDLGASIKHDIALPIAQIADFVAACERDLRQTFHEMQLVLFGHLGDGSLHYNIFLPEKTNRIYQQEHDINRIVYQQVIAHQGTIAAEHGIGSLKNQWLSRVRNEHELRLMRAIKHSLDPKGLFNPGKVLPE